MEEMSNIERAASALAEVVQNPTKSQGNIAMRPVYRELTKEEAGQLESIKEWGAKLWDKFNSLGNSRESSLAKTHLEQAVMWAVKGITR